MRILRINNLDGDKTLCYIHASSTGQSYVDGEPVTIYWGQAGESFPDVPEVYLRLVIGPGMDLIDGGYIAVNGGECVLKCSNSNRRILEVITPGFVSVSARSEFLYPIKAGVLTVSDKASCGRRVDTSGPALMELLRSQGMDVLTNTILPDDRSKIADLLIHWVDEVGLELILITGGTGISKRDITPEAVSDVAERIIPGFGEIMRVKGTLSTPTAYLSRGLGVSRRQCLIVAMPGSEKGARESFAAILPGLRHGVNVLNGRDSECGNHRHGEIR